MTTGNTKRNWKRKVQCVSAALLMAGLLAGCGAAQTANQAESETTEENLVLMEETLPQTAADETVMAKILPLAAKLGKSMKSQLGASGFNVVQNNGTSAGQTGFHLHVHVIPRYEGGPDMVNWVPGKPEQDELAQTADALKAGL